MTLLTEDALQRLAMCAAADGTEETVEVELVGAVAPGDELLVHAGTALQRLSTA
jgi:hydrogenase maturation factor